MNLQRAPSTSPPHARYKVAHQACDRRPYILLPLIVVLLLTAGCSAPLSRPLSQVHAGYGSNSANLSVIFWDVGQGDATLLTLGETRILIDAGPLVSAPTLMSALAKEGVRSIDLLVLSHPHADHIGGIPLIVANISVKDVLVSRIPCASPACPVALEELKDHGIVPRFAHAGEEFSFPGGLKINVLSADEGPYEDANDRSLVLIASYSGFHVLFPGDIDANGEEALLGRGVPIDAELLKVSHHGGPHATGPEFLSAVSPSVAVIQVGAGNEYGHPDWEVLRLLSGAGVSVFRTDLDGTVRVQSDGVNYSLATDTGGSYATLRTPGYSLAQDSASSLSSSRPDRTRISPLEFTGAVFDAPGDDRTNINGEYVVVTNQGISPINLSGYRLSDRGSYTTYTFPGITLEGGASVTIFSGDGQDQGDSLFMHAASPVWGNQGDSATLKDPDGAAIAWWPVSSP